MVMVEGIPSQKTYKGTIKIAHKQKKSQKVEFSCDFVLFFIRFYLI